MEEYVKTYRGKEIGHMLESFQENYKIENTI